MMPNIILSFDGGYLKPLKISDIHEEYIEGLNDVTVNYFLDSVKSNRQTYDSVSKYISLHNTSSDSILWGVWLEHSKNHVGTVCIHGIDSRHKTACIGICLFNQDSWGKGVGGKSIKSATTWVISALGLRWVEAGILSNNVASQKAFISAGYEWIYDVLQKYIHDGQPADVKIYVAKDINNMFSI
jgi:RimJ/RimL family protein N-acetyltransferase